MNEIAALLDIGRELPVPEALFWVALTLIAGALLGEAAFRWLGLPRIAGYSAAGMAVAAAGLGLGLGIGPGLGASDVPAPLRPQVMAATRLVVDLALALLLFELGSRVSLRWLRRNPALLWTSAIEAAVSFMAVAAALHLLDFEFRAALAGAALIVCASGAVVGRIAAELRSAGQVTERMIMFSALNTLYAVLALKLIIGWVHLDASGDWVQGLSLPLYTLGGSILLAALLHQAVAWVLRRFEMRNENTVLLLLGLILLALTGARMLNLSTLLVPLLAGVMLRNASDRPCIWPRHFGTAGGVLVLMLFVVLGSSWSPEVLVAGAFGALAVLATRWIAKAVVLVLLARASGIEMRQGFALALALSPVSATSLVLLADLQSTHPALAAQLSPIVLTAVAAMAIIGPITVQWGLRMTGEQRLPEASAAKAAP